MKSNAGLVGRIYFWGVAAPSTLFMRFSNFYTRSLIRFRPYSSQLRSVQFLSRRRELKGVAL